MLDMLIVLTENAAQKFVLGMMNRLDNVLIVTGKIEETATFARGA